MRKESIWILALLISASMLLQGCGGFKAKRVSADESDEAAMEITDKWVARDTEISVKKILEQIQKHRGFKRYLRKLGRIPKVFISEVQNRTSEAYFPIEDLNDELLNEFSMSGDYVLIDAAQRDAILKEIQYQNDGMVDPTQIKTIGKQAGADLLIFGAIRMKPKSRKGKTIKEYSVNMRMTDLESGVEVLRTRSKLNKFSSKSSMGW
jgi:penicillin-binding protein activator